MRNFPYWLLFVFIFPQNLSSRKAGIETLWLQQSPRRLQIILESEAACEIYLLPKPRKVTPTIPRPLCRGKEIRQALRFLEVPFGNDQLGYFDPLGKILFLPKIAKLNDPSFQEFWRRQKPRVILLASFGSDKQSLNEWNKRSRGPMPQWILPDHKERQTRKFENQWSRSLYRRDWPRLLKIQSRLYREDPSSIRR